MATSGSEDSDIIEEEVKEHKEEDGSRQSPAGSRHSSSPPPPSASSRPAGSSISSATAFSFWARFTLLVSIVSFVLASLYSLSPKDDKSWFLGLPYDLRRHYSQGRLVKAQVGAGGAPAELFAVEHGPRSGENILLLHGLGCSSYSFRSVLHSLGTRGHRAVAIDLPGAGFSDKLVPGRGDRWGGALGRVWGLYSEIKDKGLFWGFDQLVETGQIPYEEEKFRASARNNNKNQVYGPREMSQIIGQVIDSLALAPVHLVLHDSALGVGAEWVLGSPGSVSSVTLVDSTSESAAFPSWILGVPVLSEIILRSHFLFAGLLRLCCSRSMDGAVGGAYLYLLNGRNGRRAVVESGRALNFSFDVGEWAASEAMKDVPLQVLWSNTWSDVWIDEGRRVADAVPHSRFVNHYGGRWPQASEVLQGLFLPQLKGDGATGLAISLLGAMVMPHNLFLHSALVLSRKVPRPVQGIKEGAADEIAEKISEFVSSLPKSVRRIEEETLPEHIQKLFNEASEGSSHHHHGHNHHHHGQYHDQHADFVGAYGLGHGW